MPTPDEFGRYIGARIRELRLEAELNQEELAERLETFRPLVSRVEAGKHVISIDLANQYAQALEVDTAVILTVIDDDWCEETGWSPEEVERWWPKIHGARRMRKPCVAAPIAETSSGD